MLGGVSPLQGICWERLKTARQTATLDFGLQVIEAVPKPAAWLFAGICLGLAAIMGRNHGVYGAVASIFVISALLVLAPSPRALAGLCGYFVLGVLIGFSPTLIMMLAIDGFTAAFINSIV